MTDCKFVKKISKPVCKLTYFKTLGHIYVQLHNIRYTIDKNMKIFSTGPVRKKRVRPWAIVQILNTKTDTIINQYLYSFIIQ